jgi:phosphate-selective porin
VGAEDRYEVEQAMVETAIQGRGFSWQQEYHWKRVEDTFTGRATDLEGYYLQAGYFFHALLEWVPRPLELAARWAEVDQNVAVDALDDRIRELTFAANWFFAGHRNKLTLDFSFLEREAADPAEREERRLRLQWDVSF